VCCVPANTDRRRRTEQEANAASFTYFLRRGLRSEQWHSRIGAHGRPAEWGLPQRKRQRGASRSPTPARVGVGEARAIVSPILRVRGFISRVGHLPALTAPQPPPPPGHVAVHHLFRARAAAATTYCSGPAAVKVCDRGDASRHDHRCQLNGTLLSAL
jgi:hypothetical protein